jgi:hypothetical protein
MKTLCVSVVSQNLRYFSVTGGGIKYPSNLLGYFGKLLILLLVILVECATLLTGPGRQE